jgi:hypothetical protein
MWRAARALISWGYTTLGGASSPDKISNNVNNINDLKFYHSIRGSLENSIVPKTRSTPGGESEATPSSRTRHGYRKAALARGRGMAKNSVKFPMRFLTSDIEQVQNEKKPFTLR